jgi:hypothetical protein
MTKDEIKKKPIMKKDIKNQSQLELIFQIRNIRSGGQSYPIKRKSNKKI